MMPTKNFRKIASSLILVSILFTITITYATTENNYKTDNNFLTDISESTHMENGYKANIIVNPYTTGIYATENGYKLDLTINPQGIGGSPKENNYQLDLIPEKTFPDIPDVAVTKIATSKTVVGQGYSILINVTVTNQALNYETFYVIIHANTTTIKTQTVTLTRRSSTTITFTWNTTGFAKGNYTITAKATIAPGEIDTGDNKHIDGSVRVNMVGDVAPEYGLVDIVDVVYVAIHFGAEKGKPPPVGAQPYEANADINGDGIIDIVDIVIIAIHFGEKDP